MSEQKVAEIVFLRTFRKALSEHQMIPTLTEFETLKMYNKLTPSGYKT